jgi:mannose-1-phosphate guanylyltransferase
LPKQFLPLPGGAKTFFQAACERAFAALKEDGHLIIVANKTMTELVLRDCAAFPVEQRSRIVLIPEPMPKNTAAAIACAVWTVDSGQWTVDSIRSGRKASTNADNTVSSDIPDTTPYPLPPTTYHLPPTVLVLSSDHLIETTREFSNCASALGERIKERGLGIFGIPPSRAETGYGYIETEPEPGDYPLRRVISFHEKPDAQTAERYLTGGNYFWNSGMFAFNAGYMAGLFQNLAPSVWLPFQNLKAPSGVTVQNNISILNDWTELEEAYKQCESISFDYAIAEKVPTLSSRRNESVGVVMAAASFTWADIGSWDEYAKTDTGKGKVYAVESEGNYVNSEIPVALCGVNDLIVVIKNGADGSPPVALITKKGGSQNVRRVAEMQLKQN